MGHPNWFSILFSFSSLISSPRRLFLLPFQPLFCRFFCLLLSSQPFLLLRFHSLSLLSLQMSSRVKFQWPFLNWKIKTQWVLLEDQVLSYMLSRQPLLHYAPLKKVKVSVSSIFFREMNNADQRQHHHHHLGTPPTWCSNKM